MLEELRRIADQEARIASKAMNDYTARTGLRSGYLDARYTAAERLLDMIDAEITARQAQDPGAPDYFGIFTCEAEARAAFGDR